MDTFFRIIVRAAALVGFAVTYDAVLALLPSPTGDANIGAGLLAFVLFMGIAAAWALVDGTRLHLRAAALVWTGAALGFAGLESLRFQVEEYAAGVDFRVSELVGQAVFLGVLVVVPAVLGAAVGRSQRHVAQSART